MAGSNCPRLSEWLVESTQIGQWRRVAVLDPATGYEAVVHGPLTAAEADLVALACKRLVRPAKQADTPATEPRAAGVDRLV